MNVHAVERFLERREIDRNNKISAALKGRMKPSDADVVRKLKKKNAEGEMKKWN